MPSASDTVKAFAISHPATAYTASATALGLFALNPTPPLIPVVLLVAILRLSAWTFVPRQHGYRKGLLQATAIAVSAGAAHLAPSLDATSTPQSALLIVSSISLVFSAFAVSLVFLGIKFGSSGNTHWSKLTVFPALWASGWAFMSQVTGVGQLATWSPVVGQGPYEWSRQVFGQWGIDWITAAWAVVISEVLGDWLVGAPDHDEDALVDTEPLLGDHAPPQYGSAAQPTAKQTPASLSRSRSLLVLTGALVLLMVPSYLYPETPLPRVPGDDITALKVACALPISRTGNPTLAEFIHETRTVQGAADVILWPESAVRFESPEDRDATFARIQNGSGASNKYIGVSFEEYVPAERRGERGHSYNGFALLPTPEGPPVINYYKRNLVPVAESFSLTPGTEPPTIFTLELARPKGATGPQTRPIPLTASICLDFATTSSFTPVARRPALILAPAKTWHPSVGRAMWEQAKARAAETGATVLWCDGGRGGLSGLADARYSEVVQVGPGSWSKPVGVRFPFDERRTVYGWGGQWLAFGAVWGVVAMGYGVEVLVVYSAGALVRRAVRGASARNLLDA